MATGDQQALVLLSGGQDSTTCLYWALDRFGAGNVAAVSFDYGQRHRIELECAEAIASAADVAHVCLPIDTFTALGGDALTDVAVDVASTIDPDTALPNTFVPGRNIIFLTYAAAYAYRRDISNLVVGVAQTDYSGYPDCREPTIRSIEATLRLGMEFDVTIHAPLMQRSKKDTVLLAQQVGALPAMAMTHTCYNGQRPPCGTCAACELRAKGFAEAGIDDPLLQAT